MNRRWQKYSQIGRKIAMLGLTQYELAEIMGLTQQSVSGKMTGRISVRLDDLEKLAEHLDLPLLYFFTPESVTADLTRSMVKLLTTPGDARQAVMEGANLPPVFLQQLAAIAEAMAQSAKAIQPVPATQYFSMLQTAVVGAPEQGQPMSQQARQ
jgi:transcriptional regulator with XRE-family HTH domain